MDSWPIPLSHPGQTLGSRGGTCRDGQPGILRCVQDPASPTTPALRLPRVIEEISIVNYASESGKSPHDNVLGILIEFLCGLVNSPRGLVDLPRVISDLFDQ